MWSLEKLFELHSWKNRRPLTLVLHTYILKTVFLLKIIYQNSNPHIGRTLTTSYEIQLKSSKKVKNPHWARIYNCLLCNGNSQSEVSILNSLYKGLRAFYAYLSV